MTVASVLLQFAGFILDLDGRTLSDPSGADISLTTAEFDLLATFVRRLVGRSARPPALLSRRPQRGGF